MKAFGFMLVDCLQEVWICIKQVTPILPIVARGYQQAAVLWKDRLHAPQPWQQVRHLQAQRLQTSKKREVRKTGKNEVEKCVVKISQDVKKVRLESFDLSV